MDYEFDPKYLIDWALGKIFNGNNNTPLSHDEVVKGYYTLYSNYNNKAADYLNYKKEEEGIRALPEGNLNERAAKQSKLNEVLGKLVKITHEIRNLGEHYIQSTNKYERAKLRDTYNFSQDETDTLKLYKRAIARFTAQVTGNLSNHENEFNNSFVLKTSYLDKIQKRDDCESKLLKEINKYISSVETIDNAASSIEEKNSAFKEVEKAADNIQKDIPEAISSDVELGIEPNELQSNLNNSIQTLKQKVLAFNQTMILDHISKSEWDKAIDILQYLPDKESVDGKVAIASSQYLQTLSHIKIANTIVQTLSESTCKQFLQSTAYIATSPLVSKHLLPHISTSFPIELIKKFNENQGFFNSCVDVVGNIDALNKAVFTRIIQCCSEKKAKSYNKCITKPLNLASDICNFGLLSKSLIVPTNPLDFASSAISCGFALNSLVSSASLCRNDEISPLRKTIKEVEENIRPFNMIFSAGLATEMAMGIMIHDSRYVGKKIMDTLLCLAKHPRQIPQTILNRLGISGAINYFCHKYTSNVIDISDKIHNNEGIDKSSSYIRSSCSTFLDKEFVDTYKSFISEFDRIISSTSTSGDESQDWLELIDSLLYKFTVNRNNSIYAKLMLAKIKISFNAKNYSEVVNIFLHERNVEIGKFIFILTLERGNHIELSELEEIFKLIFTNEQKQVLKNYADCLLALTDNTQTDAQKINLISNFFAHNQISDYEFIDLRQRELTLYLNQSQPDFENISRILNEKKENIALHAIFTSQIFSYIKNQYNNQRFDIAVYNNLRSLHYQDVLFIYLNYLEQLKMNLPERFTTLDRLLNELKSKKEIEFAYNIVVMEKLSQCVETAQYDVADLILSETSVISVHNSLICDLLNKFINLPSTYRGRTLKQIHDQLSHLLDRDVLMLFDDFIRLSKSTPSAEQVGEIENILEQFNTREFLQKYAMIIRCVRARVAVIINDSNRIRELIDDPQLQQIVKNQVINLADYLRYKNGVIESKKYLEKLMKKINHSNDLFITYLAFLGALEKCGPDRENEAGIALALIDELTQFKLDSHTINGLNNFKFELQMELYAILYKKKKFKAAEEFLLHIKQCNPNHPSVEHINLLLERIKIYTK